jgi:hypothetical protein
MANRRRFCGNQLFQFQRKNSDGTKKGPVGRLSTEGPSEVFEIYAQELSSTNANVLKKCFLKHI